MLNDQLVEYIRGEAAKGLHRAALSKVLIDAGWPAQDVHEALVALSVPMDDVAVTASETPSAPTFAPMAGVVASTTTTSPVVPIAVNSVAAIPTAPTPVAPIGMPAMVPGSYGRNSGKLPGVISLIKNGFLIYRTQFKTLIAISALQFVLTVAILGAIVYGVWIVAHTVQPFPPAFIAMVAVAAAVLILVFSGLSVWVALSSMHAIRGSEEKLSFMKSFGRARPQVWALLWIYVLRMFTVLGALVLYAVIPAIVLGEVSTLAQPYLGGYFSVILIGITVLGVLSALVVGVRFMLLFLFSPWVLVNAEGKGREALLQSSTLTRSLFGAIFWRVAGISLLLGIVEGVCRFGLSAAFGHDSHPYGFAAATSPQLILYLAITALVLTPVLSATFYTLYASARNIVGIGQITSDPKRTTGTLAILGALAVIAVPVLMVVLALTHSANPLDFLSTLARYHKL